jgi:uncharacterized protein with FMN-binding domain
MANRPAQTGFSPRRTLRRLFLSAFVVVSFVAYALHKPSNSAQGSVQNSSNNPGAPSDALAPTAITAAPQQQGTHAVSPTAAATSAGSGSQPATDAPAPTQTTAPTDTPAAASGAYKNGTFTGPEVDAFYGLVQVKVVVQNGKISDVQVPEYPTDRRTSQMINQQAVPWLQQEAMQAQNANVDIITGATLTSQAFAQSLQTALDQAQK